MNIKQEANATFSDWIKIARGAKSDYSPNRPIERVRASIEYFELEFEEADIFIAHSENEDEDEDDIAAAEAAKAAGKAMPYNDFRKELGL